MILLYEVKPKSYKSGSVKRFFMFECPVCKKTMERQKNQGLNAKMCKECDFKNRKGNKNPAYIHGGTNSRLYRIYNNIKNRCYYKKSDHYYRYGERGIKMCDEWLKSFEAFSAWAIANGYNDTLTIDRINVNGDYEPKNCQWLTMLENTIKDRTKYTKEIVEKIINVSKANKIPLYKACEILGYKYTSFKQAKQRFKKERL